MTSQFNDLVDTAVAEGTLSADSFNLLQNADLAQKIKNNFGADIADMDYSSQSLFGLVIDDSGSIEYSGNSQIMRDSHNTILNALTGSKDRSGMLMQTLLLNNGFVYNWSDVNDVNELDNSNYKPDGGTPLFDQLAVMFGSVLLKITECEDNFIDAKAFVSIITDGGNNASRNYTQPEDLRPLVEDLKQKACLITAIGVDDGYTDYVDVYTRMGIDREWIITPPSDPSELRKIWMLLSQTSLRVSQAAGATNSTQLANNTNLAGGFMS